MWSGVRSAPSQGLEAAVAEHATSRSRQSLYIHSSALLLTVNERFLFTFGRRLPNSARCLSSTLSVLGAPGNWCLRSSNVLMDAQSDVAARNGDDCSYRPTLPAREADKLGIKSSLATWPSWEWVGVPWARGTQFFV